MIDQTNTQHHEQLVQQMNSPSTVSTQTTESQWFMPHLDNSASQVTASDVPASAPSAQDNELLNRLKLIRESTKESSSHMRTLNKDEAGKNPASPREHNAYDPVIMSLANRDDLTIQTLDHEAKKKHDKDDEVVISLH